MVLRWLLAILLIAMGLGQASDFAGFVDVVETYQVGWGAFAPLFATVVLAFELSAGAGLAAGRRLLRGKGLEPAALVALAVAVGWSILAVQAFARGLDVPNCGCFGVHFGQSLRWWILLEDAEFVFMAAWALRGIRRTRSTGLGLAPPLATAVPPREVA